MGSRRVLQRDALNVNGRVKVAPNGLGESARNFEITEA